MIERARKTRNAKMLAQIDPSERPRFRALLDSLEGRGLRPRAQQAFRSPKDQDRAFASGASTLRGGQSYHNRTQEGGLPASLALDVVDDDSPLSPSIEFLADFAIAAFRQGLSTGIHWGLSGPQRGAILDAVSLGAELSLIQLIHLGGRGWDPLHAERKMN